MTTTTDRLTPADVQAIAARLEQADRDHTRMTWADTNYIERNMASRRLIDWENERARGDMRALLGELAATTAERDALRAEVRAHREARGLGEE